jgi:hypothetical protein
MHVDSMRGQPEVTSPLHSKKAMIAFAVVIAFVAIVLPTCRMVGCSMSSMGGSMGGSMGMHDMGLSFNNACDGSMVTNVAPLAIVPAGAESLVLALVAALVAALVLFRPPVLVQAVRSHSTDPPPPPEDPRGERLRV